jgi:hypothetical protein
VLLCGVALPEAFVGDKSDGISRSDWSACTAYVEFRIHGRPHRAGAVIPYTNIQNAFSGVALFMAAGARGGCHQDASGAQQPSEATAPTGVSGMPLIIYVMIMWGSHALLPLLFPPMRDSRAHRLIDQLPCRDHVSCRTLVSYSTAHPLASGVDNRAWDDRALSASMLFSWTLPPRGLRLLWLSSACPRVYCALPSIRAQKLQGFYAGLFESAIGIGELIGPMLMGYIGFIYARRALPLAAILDAVSACLP